ncbi:MAG: nucleoside deaminase [Planctomycetes bacterium]|nr:nucleoside deaminase [Planctomycetota bacterium]
MPFPSDSERWMRAALLQAQAALEAGEEPVGAVLVEAATGRIVARAHDQRRALNDPTAHATMLALSGLAQAEQMKAEFEAAGLPPDELDGALQAVGLDGLVLVVTREPCLMCAGAVRLHPEVKQLVFGASREALGGAGSALNLFRAAGALPALPAEGGVLRSQATALLQEFALRRKTRQ